MHKRITQLLCGVLLTTTPLLSNAQLTLPPSGDNQQSAVSQWMGPVRVDITYSSPDVHAPDGSDRTGHIWGELVPYGMVNLQFGYSNENHPSPWRGGANMNTTISFSHDVLVNGSALKAGTYGLHFIPNKDEWTVIFSSNSTSWGSFFYKPEEDVLRVQTKPAANNYHEWLTYEFTDRQTDACTVELMWELLRVPISIKVPDIKQVYVENFRKQLRSDVGFNYQAWVDAANYCVANNVNLQEALTWANYAIEEPFFGRVNFATLSCKAGVLKALGKTVQSDSIMKVAIADPTASLMDVHFYARGLQAEKKNKEALEIFLINYQKHPESPVTNLGLARGYSANGDYKNALKYAKAAQKLNPDPQVKQTLENAIKTLEAGKDFN
ncbi:MAG TPA: DUF2911 domain-containing protein [Chitinophagales bacterium]|nr:DUF2911 domain-containing protein [Chitinophagales bacterium]